LILKKEEDIKQYVINTVKNYFRTVNKSAVNLNSNLMDHGLDSLDSIEISMQVNIILNIKTLKLKKKLFYFW